MSYTLKSMLFQIFVHVLTCAVSITLVYLFPTVSMVAFVIIGAFTAFELNYKISRAITKKVFPPLEKEKAQERDLCPLCRNVLDLSNTNLPSKDSCPLCGNKDFSKVINENCKF